MEKQEETNDVARPRAGRRSRYSSVISTRPKPLDVERPPPWNKWFHKVIHYWRYGYSHPDEDLLGVIEAIGDALHVQVIAAKAVLTGERADKAEEIRQQLDEELDRPLPDFSTLLGIEARINALYPPAMARKRRWVLRDRFERVAPPGAFQNWQLMRLREKAAQRQAAPTGQDASAPDAGDAGAERAPPDDGGGGGSDGGNGTADEEPAAPMTEAEADSSTLLSYIHANYLMTIGREKAVRDLKRWLLMRFWLFLLFLIPLLFVVWLALWWNDMGEYWGLLLGLFLVAAAGRAGATTSVIRRLQTAISGNVLAADPVIELTALRTGKNEISMALVSASIFALLMWAFFASGIPQYAGFDGGLFPRALASQARTNATPQETRTTGETTDDKDAADNGMATANQSGGEAGAPPPEQQAGAGGASRAGGKETVPPATVPPPPAAAGETAERAVPSSRGRLDAAAREALARGETEVRRAERSYRMHMARHSAAGGLGNWSERRRLRGEARAAIAAAVLVQDQIVELFESRLRQAQTGGDREAVRGWQADLIEAVTHRTALVDQGNAIGGSAKPAPSVACPANKDCNPFRALAAQLRLADESDFFKLLLWAFIAGFAERFVPDMLDRVVARSRGASTLGSDAVIAAQVRAGMPPPAPPPPPPPPPAPAGDGDGSGP